MVRLLYSCTLAGMVVLSLCVPAQASLRRKAWRVRCKDNLKKLSLAVILYQEEHQVYPQYLIQTLPHITGYDDRRRYLTCPFNKHINPFTAAEIDDETDYLYRHPATKSDTLPILADQLANHNFESVNLAFVDGHDEMKDVTPETIALIREAFGDTAVTQEYIDYINRSKLQVATDDTLKFIKNSWRGLLFLLFLLGVIASYACAGMAIRRYKKQYNKTPTWKDMKVWYTVLTISRFIIWLVFLLLLTFLLLPALRLVS